MSGSPPPSGTFSRADTPEDLDPSSDLAPCVRKSVRLKTIDSLRSTGSQSDYFRPEQTIILLDWDDTLCPSSWIRGNKPALSLLKPVPEEEKYQKPLRELQKQAEAVLSLALKMGKVIIVTNAMEPWVETSCKNFLPRLMPFVERIPIVYARSVYDSCDRTPSSSRSFGANSKLQSFNCGVHEQHSDTERMPQHKWKEVAFGMEIAGFYSRYEHQSWKNVVSIGDSVFERDAVQRVVLNRPSAGKKCRTKTAKLLDEPDIFQLIAQFKVIHDALGMMVQYDGNLEIEIDEKDLEMDLALADKIMDD